MKKSLLFLVTSLLVFTLWSGQSVADVKSDLQELVTKVRAKVQKGEKTEADLSEELKKFDELLAAHKDEKTEEVAQIGFMKGVLYASVMEDFDKAATIFKQVQTDFPDTEMGKRAGETVKGLVLQKQAKKVQDELTEGSPFPEFAEQDVEGKPISVSAMKGKVVLVDFWATWCGPCVAELPNVLKAYDKYHEKGFEILGVSLDQDKEKLTTFTKEHKMAWQQYFDGKGWENKVSMRYGVNSIPATYLLDKDGKIIGKNLRGEALDTALAKALP